MSTLQEPDAFIENFIQGFERLIDSEDNIDFYLDLIGLFLNMKNDDKKEIILSLNKILYKYSLGYQIDIVKDQIIRIDSKYVYKETTQKVLLLLHDIQFQNVDDEYRKAYKELKNGNYEGVLVEANKAFESTMKIICELKDFGLPKSHAVSALIAHLRKNNFIENFQDEKFNGLAKTLQSPAIIRNNQGGHGQGSERRELPIMYAEYALQVTASNILLLIGIYNESI
jgi:HEPN domain-containing protein